MSASNKVARIVMAVLAIGIGLYPLLYLFLGREFGLLGGKEKALLADAIWNIAFYGHILFGGAALMVGWAQFSRTWRSRYPSLHRKIGKCYVATALLSALCGVYLGFYATGGALSATGFVLLGAVWIFTTHSAYRAIKKGDVKLHEGYMVYSYAACFAAVTLRLWLPLLILMLSDYIMAYRIVAWLCWVPNLAFAYLWVRGKGIRLG